MRYTEYLNCAFKHLKGCEAMLASYTEDQLRDPHFYLDLYYLSGYIIESLVVYSAYKLHGWRVQDDIKTKFSIQFTTNTGLDYYYCRRLSGTARQQYGEFPFPGRISNNCLSVQGHRFQPIVNTLLKVDPSFDGVPYFGDGAIDHDVEDLILKWNPGVRYYYVGCNNLVPTLNLDVLSRLIQTCNLIYTNHI